MKGVLKVTLRQNARVGSLLTWWGAGGRTHHRKRNIENGDRGCHGDCVRLSRICFFIMKRSNLETTDISLHSVSQK